jgi:hypothetical protein
MACKSKAYQKSIYKMTIKKAILIDQWGSLSFQKQNP